MDIQPLERRFWIGFLLGIITGTLVVLTIQGMIADLKVLLPTLGTVIVILAILAVIATAVRDRNVPRAIWILLVIGGILVFSRTYILPRIDESLGSNTPHPSNTPYPLKQNYYRSVCIPPMQFVVMLESETPGAKPVQNIPCNVTNILKLNKLPKSEDGRTLLFVEYQGVQGWVDSQYLK